MGIAVGPSYPIRTERLELRPFEPEDFDALLDIYSRPEVATYLYEGARGEDEVRELLRKKVAARALVKAGDALSLAAILASTGDLIGDVLGVWTSAEHRQGEVGYVVHPDHQGNGYATEAVEPVLALLFGDLGLHRVIGRLEARNAASARVLEKLGMRREAHLVENEWVKNEWQSEVVYAILDREWAARLSSAEASETSTR
ncbi:MAG TPA: GNAT family protein [Actinomycetota bacterium]|nr:GNAT family protein [Actinomycetota bacterium]